MTGKWWISLYFMLLYSAYGLTSSLLCFNSIQMKHTLGYVKKTGISPPVPHICIYFYVHSLNTVHTWSVVNLTLTKLFSFIFPMLYSRWFLFGCQFLALSTRSFSSTFTFFVTAFCCIPSHEMWWFFSYSFIS